MEEDSFLIELRNALDATISSPTQEAYGKLARGLLAAVKRLQHEHPASFESGDDADRTIEIIRNAWLKGVAPPEDPALQSKLSALLSDILLTQKFALAMSRGDLSQSLKAKGVTAGGLKALQAALRHLTWQTKMVAEGDFTQKVEFMGEFSDSFNSMTARLAEGREALARVAGELERRVQERTDELQEAYDRHVQETKEREQLEAQLRQAQKMEALGTLVSGIAHDFNNILAAIIGFSEMASARVSDNPRVAQHLKRIFQAGVRARELIKQMMTFSRKAEQEKKPLQLSGVVREAMRLLRASIPTTISIRFNIRSESGLILGDPVQIEQVFLNLCTNAAHAMENGGVLNVDLSDFSISKSHRNPASIRPGSYMKLDVRDTGIGISPDIIDKIFDPFFTTKKPGEGTGLGLSAVHGIVLQHEGYITVESVPGKGSTFTVYFPKIAETMLHEAASEQPIPTGTERVLIVDDEEALAEMGQEILEELGYRVTAKTSSAEALSLFRAGPDQFDLIITDQTMPELTGVELAREIMAIRQDIPIILCTGFSRLVDVDSAKELGIRALAIKPLTKREIARTLREVLAG